MMVFVAVTVFIVMSLAVVMGLVSVEGKRVEERLSGSFRLHEAVKPPVSVAEDRPALPETHARQYGDGHHD